MFEDREDAGRKLAVAIAAQHPEGPVVLALPRGGVPVALPVAEALAAPLDLVMVRKIGSPGRPEVAAGAVVDGDRPQTVFNRDVLRNLSLTEDDFKEAIETQLAEIERRRGIYFKGRAAAPLVGRTVIVVDDGIATGATAKVALQALRDQGAKEVWLAVPVAPKSVLAEMKGLVDRVICLDAPEEFIAVGQYYRHFDQTRDEDVVALLKLADAIERNGDVLK